MSDSKLLEELKRLYQLAVLRDGEENDEGRKNEARNAAYLLINKACKGGVRLWFELPTVAPKQPEIRMRQTESPGHDPITDFVRRARAASEPYERVNQDFADLMSDIFNAKAREAASGESPFVRPTGSNPFGRSPRRRGSRSQVVLLRSKFGGQCVACQTRYGRDELVHWLPKVGCTHERCGPDVLIAAAERLSDFDVNVDDLPGDEAP